MTAPRYRGLRFVQPDLEPEEKKRGLCITPGGDLEMVEEEALVSQAILLLIATRPGERVMRPRYGCDLNRLAFSPNDDTTAAFAEHYVRRALETWEPRIDILALDAVGDEEASRLTITLEYRLRASQSRNRLAISFALEEGAS